MSPGKLKCRAEGAQCMTLMQRWPAQAESGLAVAAALTVMPRPGRTLMREQLRSATARRDDRLARIRKLTLWITGGAAAASLGLGTAFAHALPGHAAGTAGSSRTVHAAAPPAASGQARAHGRKHETAAQRRHRNGLAAPKQPPAAAPTPVAPVTSGGS